jgi:HlyD family secretion protein
VKNKEDKKKKGPEKKAEPDSTAKKGSGEKPEDVPPVKVVFQIKDGTVKQVQIVTGTSSDTEWEIKSGLEEGWEVVTGPYRILSKQLNDGDAVTVDNSMKREMREDEEK